MTLNAKLMMLLSRINVKCRKAMWAINAKMPKRKERTRTRKKGLDTESTQTVKHRKTSFSISSLATEQRDADFFEQDYFSTPDELVDLAQLNLTQKPKRGRRTTSDDFLLEVRDEWLYFFEGFWHEIGPSLLQIRERGMSTIEEIRCVFEPINQKNRAQLSNCFVRGSPEPGESKRRRANKIRLSKLRTDVRRMQSERQELETACGYAENAL